MFVGPKLPQKCASGSMVPLLTDHSAIALIGCLDEKENEDKFNGKIYHLSWDYGGNLVWKTMNQLLKYQRWNAVAMVIPDNFTNCKIT